MFMDGTHPLSRLLKKGFQHCFVCIVDNGLWIQIDGGINSPTVRYLTTDDFDMAGYWRDRGMTVVETRQHRAVLHWPFAVRNCVGLVKTILCLPTWAWTPNGLYKYLLRNP